MERRFIAIGIFGLFFTFQGEALSQTVELPEDLVNHFMKNFYSGNDAADFRQPKVAKRYFTPQTATKVIRQGKSWIEVDFITDSQDYDIKDLKVRPGAINNKDGTVIVNFKNFGEKITNKFILEKTAASWKIRDICKPDNRCLSEQ